MFAPGEPLPHLWFYRPQAPIRHPRPAVHPLHACAHAHSNADSNEDRMRMQRLVFLLRVEGMSDEFDPYYAGIVRQLLSPIGEEELRLAQAQIALEGPLVRPGRASN